jgi:hypothetical protein
VKTAALAWLFFLLTGIFISLTLPLGEGFDEPYHFGYIQYIAQTHRLPPGPHLHLSVELESFLQHHPMGWRLQQIFPDFHTQEHYWQESASDRETDDAVIRNLRFPGSYVEGSARFAEQYESHQAPLYYALSAPLFLRLSRSFSLVDTFLVMRIWSVILASAVVPLSYFLARYASASPVVPGFVAVLVAMFPGLYPDLARISNDALMVPLAAAVLVSLSRWLDSRTTGSAFLLGLTLVAGLSTKAFFIPIALAVLLILIAVRQFRLAAITALTSAISCFWYIRNAWITGSATGLPETVSSQSTILSSIQSVGSIQWWDVLKLTAVSHIWMGNWSLLQYRSWMYEVVMAFFAIGVLGFVIHLARDRSPILLSLCLVYATFGLALAYYATQVVQQTGVPIIQGWYLSPMVPIEAIVFTIGTEFLFRKWFRYAAAFVATCFLTLMIYGNVFIAAPYYTGLTDHAPSGHLRAYHPHWGDVAVMMARLTRFHPAIPTFISPLLAIAILATGCFLIWNLFRSAKV